MADHRMKSKLCPNQKDRCKDLSHLKSFSSSRQHRRKISNLNTNLFNNDNYVSSSITLPISTGYDTTSRHHKKSTSKQFQPLPKNRKTKSREIDTNNLKKDVKRKSMAKGSRSNQKVKKSIHKNHQQAIKPKNSPIKIISDSVTQPNIKPRLKKVSNKKIDKSSRQKVQKKSKNKNKMNLSIGVSWQKIIEQYGDCLSVAQMAEIKEYKWIYFLGKIRERTNTKNNNQILSARGYPHIHELQQQQKLNQLDCLTQLKTNPHPHTRLQSTEDQFYKYETGDHIAYRYEIVHCINRGSFGQVLKVYDHKSKEYLALKIVKKCQELVQQTFEEISILTQIKESDKANISGVVRIKDFTIFRNHICILFELLNGNLYELLAANNYNGLGDDIVRIFAVQILNSLQFLEKERVIHCDLKPENIVMKTWGKSGIKLVDFGTSCLEGKQMYEYLQSRYYRAPQIILRKPYSFPIDMWSLGCLLAQLKIGQPIFAGSNNIEQLMYMVNSIGYPIHEDGPYSSAFLDSEQFRELVENDYIGQYRRRLRTGQGFSDHKLFAKCKYLGSCMKTLKERLLAKQQSKDNTFTDFILKILVWEPSKRLKPLCALQETWIVKGLPKEIKQLYTIVNSDTAHNKPVNYHQPRIIQSRNKNHSKKSKDKNSPNPLSEQRRRQSKSHNSKASNGKSKSKNTENGRKNTGIGFGFG